MMRTTPPQRLPEVWPSIPPWWLLSTPQVAALINLTPATLSAWRIRGEGPPHIPSMYLKPAQGQPVFYQYGAVRAWAASAAGLDYPMADQCRDFLEAVAPNIERGTGTTEAKARVFDELFNEERRLAANGEPTRMLALSAIESLDRFASHQPRWASDSMSGPRLLTHED
ncbi:hypothetical protein P2H44_21330 [Albimonas sp. CAU 1670]|uniref:hypothetical protein n=1 Tax=Albimonas sp. CAU 1670 TaxID=3032599 RepID=UPI0023DB3986|nr:hypothetical protein [Albimonas sp. CAU 1670]MDF2235108.1 hypothetical protein [Albimonas sp. CAU 1670]